MTAHGRQGKRGADASTETHHGDESALRMESAARHVRPQPEAGGDTAGFDWLGRIPMLRRLVLGVPDAAQR